MTKPSTDQAAARTTSAEGTAPKHRGRPRAARTMAEALAAAALATSPAPAGGKGGE